MNPLSDTCRRSIALRAASLAAVLLMLAVTASGQTPTEAAAERLSSKQSAVVLMGNWR